MGYKITRKEEGTCLECGAPIIYGRKDKHFCDGTCKNKYHNRELRQKRLYKEQTLAALSRNYEILDALLKENTTSVPLEELILLGFEPDRVTGHRKGRHRHEEYACFDLSYTLSGSKLFNLTRRASGEY